MNDFELPTSKASNSLPKAQLKPSTSPVETYDTSQTPTGSTGAAGETTDSDSNEPTYSKEELLRVFDELIFSGHYSETFQIRGKLSVTLQARTAEEINQIQQAIDSANLKLISSVETMRSFMNLQYSLVNYGGRDLSVMKIEEKRKFIERLPGVIIGSLINLMAKFDHKVAKACEEGEENF